MTPLDTPQNGEYLVAAYIITAVILLGYWLRLWRQVSSVSGEEERERGRSLPRSPRPSP